MTDYDINYNIKDILAKTRNCINIYILKRKVNLFNILRKAK
jgi:hypothetical protein